VNGPPGIEIEHVTRTFVLEGQRIIALEDVSLSVKPGEFVAIIGPSGCGKSTLLRLIAGLMQPTSGTVCVAGVTAEEARQHRLFGMVFQDPVLLAWRNVLDNVRLPLDVVDRATRRNAEDPHELIQLVRLEQFERAHVWQLSGGMRQRVAIARALLLRPRILLLDEPFGALDEITRQQMNLDLLRIWAARQTTAILVTHSVSEAVFLADRVVVLSSRPGRVAAQRCVPFERPRSVDLLQSPAFFEMTASVSAALLAASEGT
jgi:NitT/TauT family transport system ATP-binding protein